MSIPREVLAKYVKPGCVFIETGSRWGDTLLKAIELGAESAWGCEPDPLWYGICRQHVNEANPLAQIMVSELKSVSSLECHLAMKGDIVVFLDAHTETYSPLPAELDVIATWQTKPRAILCDDRRFFKDWGFTVEAVMGKLHAMGYKTDFDDGAAKKDILVGAR